MDKLKTFLTLIAVILVALAVLSAIGFIYTAASYVLILGIVCLGAFMAFRLLRSPDAGRIEAGSPHKELKKVERILDEYKRR